MSDDTDSSIDPDVDGGDASDADTSVVDETSSGDVTDVTDTIDANTTDSDADQNSDTTTKPFECKPLDGTWMCSSGSKNHSLCIKFCTAGLDTSLI